SWARIDLPQVDLSGLPEAPREAARARLLAEEGSRCFDLSRAPLLRATLITLGGGRHDLALTCHHSVIDGRSLGVLLSELEAFYAAGPAAPPLAPPPAARELPEPAGESPSLGFWRRALAPPVPV